MPTTQSISEQLLQAYSANARVNAYLVERLAPEIWRAKPPAPKLRTIAALVAHMHNCGLIYLRRAAPKVSVPPELDRHKVTQAAAARALTAKRRAVLEVLEMALERGGRVGGSTHYPVEFLTYYMVHDGHHRGQILIQSRLLGHPISIDTMSGMWIWTKRAGE